MIYLTDTNILYIGIDLSLSSNHVVCLDARGQKLASFSVGNDLPGANSLVEKILQLSKSHQAEKVMVGMEATSLFWWHLHQFLKEHKALNDALDVAVYTLNPKLIKKFRDLHSDLDKTDPIDAMVIADRLRFGKLPVSHLIDEQYEPLKRLTRFRYHLIKSLRTEKNYFLVHLFLKYSSWQKISPFRSAFGLTATELISDYDPEELAQASLEELAKKMADISGNRVVDPEKTAQLVSKVIKTSYALEPKFKEPVDVILSNSYDTIHFFEKKIKVLDEVIEKEFNRFPNPLLSIPGIGMVFAAGITAELGSISRFTRQSAIGKYAGLAWKRSQSSDFEAEETPRKPGNTYLRYYLVQAANSLQVHNESYKQYYGRKVGEVPKHAHKRALVLTARKLARLCFAMLRDGRYYNTEQERRNTGIPE